MKKIANAFIVVMLVWFGNPVVRAQIQLPTDPSVNNVPGFVPLFPQLFSSWFVSGSVTLNGPLNPADSVDFTNFPNWAFHQWAENMFLWVTSPAPSIYGGGNLVFTSPIFDAVSPADGNGNRTLTPNPREAHILRPLVRAAQVGVHGLPVVIDKTGKMIDVEPLRLGPSGHPITIDTLGHVVEVSRIAGSRVEDIKLLGRDGKAIKPQLGPHKMPILFDRQSRHLEIIRIIPGRNGPIFLDQFDNAIQFGEGQADTEQSVLMAQNGSLVYYAIFVNDVYACFATGSKDNSFTPAIPTFPTNQVQLGQICALAQAHGITLTDSNALTMELKTAWIETNGLDTSKYITVNAVIPTYNTSNTNFWTTNGTKQTTLALVSIHVVGSANSHPEMIWATFEHTNNTPDATYSYTAANAQGTVLTKTVLQSAAGKWLFCSSGSTGLFNVPHMHTDANGDIIANTGFHISPSDTLREMAWGSSTNEDPNFVDPTPEDSNAELILINNVVHQLLVPGDVRANYIMTGITWVSGSQPPASTAFSQESGVVPGAASVPFPGPMTSQNFEANQVGASQSANSAIETYQQAPSPAYNYTVANCFNCHQGEPNNSLGDAFGGGLSHIFGQLKPQF